MELSCLAWVLSKQTDQLILTLHLWMNLLRSEDANNICAHTQPVILVSDLGNDILVVTLAADYACCTA